MRRTLVASILALLLLLAAIAPAAAITGGQPDGDGHPYSALLLVPGVTFCSGTLIDENVVLTAGHCTWFWSNTGDPELVIDEVWVTFDSEAAVDEDWMPIPGEGTWYTSDTWFTHPPGRHRGRGPHRRLSDRLRRETVRSAHVAEPPGRSPDRSRLARPVPGLTDTPPWHGARPPGRASVRLVAIRRWG